MERYDYYILIKRCFLSTNLGGTMGTALYVEFL